MIACISGLHSEYVKKLHPIVLMETLDRLRYNVDLQSVLEFELLEFYGSGIHIVNPLLQQEVLDTLRVLIEEGGSDPMIGDSNGVTALHVFTGPWEGFEYMLHQDRCHVQLLMQSDQSGPLSTWHAGRPWRVSSRIANLAFQHERAFQSQRCCLESSGRIRIKESDHLLTLVNIIGSLRVWKGFESNSLSPKLFILNICAFENAINLLKQLIRTGVNIHHILPEHTTLDEILRPDLFGPVIDNCWTVE